MKRRTALRASAKSVADTFAERPSFKTACEALSMFVASNDGATIEDAVRAIPHHYGDNENAARALFHWAREGKIPGVHVGWRGRLYNSPRSSALSLQRKTA